MIQSRFQSFSKPWCMQILSSFLSSPYFGFYFHQHNFSLLLCSIYILSGSLEVLPALFHNSFLGSAETFTRLHGSDFYAPGWLSFEIFIFGLVSAVFPSLRWFTHHDLFSHCLWLILSDHQFGRITFHWVSQLQPEAWWAVLAIS